MRVKKKNARENTRRGNDSFPCQNVFEKYTTKTELCNGTSLSKSYILGCSCKYLYMFPHSYAKKHCLVFDKNYFM